MLLATVRMQQLSRRSNFEALHSTLLWLDFCLYLTGRRQRQPQHATLLWESTLPLDAARIWRFKAGELLTQVEVDEKDESNAAGDAMQETQRLAPTAATR
jgi:hypothetical protein